MSSTKSNTLRVPGATLSYEVRGSGPLLLLIAGGGNDRIVFHEIVGYLTDQYTVVTYDRRGLSRSQLDNPGEEQRVEAHSDDAHRLLKALGSDYESAYVFGSSGGAIIGLDLVARHPGQVYTLVAHEPPTHLLPETDPIQEMKGIQDVYRHSGVMAALQALFQLDGLDESGRDIVSELPASIKDQIVKNTIFLFEHEVAMYDHYLLDFAALASATSQTRIVLAGGHDYQEAATYLSAAAVADRLGTDMVEFPGRHAGYVSNPRAFAHRLREVLDERPAQVSQVL
ncbi:putative hydrolase YraK [Ktedonobacter sp. SOSP1-85]|uniref:alpha/beta fold hydrolase n=1 Tax=Ktedonobacter sp. SOSP1-85 TaxID=2778367 RepID=UPI0019154855|nr:alpha/beta hydrolase [Ktedonobacter sp. SOSP1-85]GHO76740.1 putative hydrolase YraK [Ktedonobacter sp. SOSP1-85]